MIRLIVLLIGIFLLWLWLATPLTKRTKIIFTLMAMLASICLIAYEVYDNKPRLGIIQASQIDVCGINVKHSYRTDYAVELCLNNTSSSTVKRLKFQVIGLRCEQQQPDQCTEIESNSHDQLISIKPNTEISMTEILRFEKIEPTDTLIRWDAKILTIKAVP